MQLVFLRYVIAMEIFVFSSDEFKKFELKINIQNSLNALNLIKLCYKNKYT